MSAKPALEPTLRALVTRDRRGLSQHPTPETLVVYHAGELPNLEEEQLRDHLALCSECAELLLDLVSFADFNPPEETATLADGEVESAWQKVQPQVVVPGIPVVRPIREKHREAAGDLVPRRRLTQVYAIAATLFLGVVGLSMWGVSLQRRIRETLQPSPNTVIADVQPEQESSRGGVEQEGAVNPGKNRFVLVLHPSLELPEFPSYAVAIRPAGGAGSFRISAEGLVRSADGTLTLGLFSGEPFTPGTYEVDLYGVAKGRREKVERLILHIASH